MVHFADPMHDAAQDYSPLDLEEIFLRYCSSKGFEVEPHGAGTIAHIIDSSTTEAYRSKLNGAR